MNGIWKKYTKGIFQMEIVAVLKEADEDIGQVLLKLYSKRLNSKVLQKIA